MNMSVKEFAHMVDITAVTAYATETDAREVVELAKKYDFIALGVMPCFFPLAKKLLGQSDIIMDGGVGFPSGAEKTMIKVIQTRDLIADGCRELDMVINVAFLKSGMYKEVENDINAVVEAAAGVPIKVILEVCYLTDDEIKRACDIVIKSGAAFVKTATGWANPTTIEHVKLITSHVGNSIKVKAAGGIRDLSTFMAMKDLGVSRFGMGKNAVKKFISELEAG